MEQNHSFRLSAPQRVSLERLLRQRKADNLTSRRANALLLLDDGLSGEQIAKVLYIDAETVRLWRKLYENGRIFQDRPRADLLFRLVRHHLDLHTHIDQQIADDARARWGRTIRQRSRERTVTAALPTVPILDQN